MSLINDALKTAQRERSGQAKGVSGSQPLLEGFFPYVSTGRPTKSRASHARVALIGVGLVVVLGVAGWYAAPAIRAAMKGVPKEPATIASAPTPSSAPVVTPAGAPEPSATTSSAAGASDSAAASVSVDTVQAPPPQPKPRTRQTSTGGKLPAAPREIAPSPDSPTRSASGSAEAIRPNLEAEAVAAFSVGDYQTAKARFEGALRAVPTASGWTNYGVTLEKLGDARAAAAAYQKAMGIDPNYLNAWLYLARLYSASGDVQRAVPLFNRALEIDPTNSDVNADLAELEFKTGAFSETRRYADVAARSNPSNPRAHYYLALSADTLKDRDVARRAFEDFLRTIAGQERENSASVGYARVRLQELKGKP